MKTAIEIYKYLPKTNCGKCGTGSCFGFAAKLATRQASPDECIIMSPAAREELRGLKVETAVSPGTVYEQALASLQPKIQALDFGKLGHVFGVKQAGPDTVELEFLNETFRVTRERVSDNSGREPKPWISILIYNHLCMPDPPAPSGEWITFSSIPASHAKDKAWAGHVEEVLARHFSGRIKDLDNACRKLGGRSISMPGSHDAAFTFRFFPHYPVLLLFYDAAPDEDFPAQCKILLDRTAPSYLDIESIVVLGEEFAGRLTAGA